MKHEPTERTAEQIALAFAWLELSDQLLLNQEAMAKYAGKWVAAYRGKVVSVDISLATLRGRLIQMRVPLATVAIRFIEHDGRAAA